MSHSKFFVHKNRGPTVTKEDLKSDLETQIIPTRRLFLIAFRDMLAR